MFFSTRSISRWAAGSICLLYLVTYVSALDILYCSTINTADTPRNSSIYQSNGLCLGFCNQNYAFAIVQNDGCWCSNYAPQTETDGCNRNCPGYPIEQCGGTGKYGYIQLMNQASGTRGAGSTSATSTRPASITTVTKSPETVTATIVISPPVFTSISEIIPNFISSNTNPSVMTSSASKSSTWVPTPIVSLETVTGQIRTITLLPTQPPDSEKSNESSQKASGLGVGGAVGLTVGLVALLALIGSIIFFCLKKRRQQKKDAEFADTSKESVQETGGPIPSRTMSENSRYVLGTDGRQVVETWENDNRDAAGSRKSRLMPVDPRLDPFSAVYQRGENKSRESVNTIRDDHDYSRRVHQGAPILRATNPDA